MVTLNQLFSSVLFELIPIKLLHPLFVALFSSWLTSLLFPKRILGASIMTNEHFQLQIIPKLKCGRSIDNRSYFYQFIILNLYIQL